MYYYCGIIKQFLAYVKNTQEGVGLGTHKPNIISWRITVYRLIDPLHGLELEVSNRPKSNFSHFLVHWVAVVDKRSCIDCGLCSTTCKSDAMNLERKPDASIVAPPADRREWGTQ